MATQHKPSIRVHLYDEPHGSNARHPIAHATLSVHDITDTTRPVLRHQTGADGKYEFRNLIEGHVYDVVFEHMPALGSDRGRLRTKPIGGGVTKADFNLGLNARVTITYESGQHGGRGGRPRVGETVGATVEFDGSDQEDVTVHAEPQWDTVQDERLMFVTTVRRPGPHAFRATLRMPMLVSGAVAATDTSAAELVLNSGFTADDALPTPISGQITVAKTRTASPGSSSLTLDELIRCSTEAMSFCNYMDIINRLFCKGKDARHPPCGDGSRSSHSQLEHVKHMYHQIEDKRTLPFIDADSYRVLKAATEAFVMVNCACADDTMTFDERKLIDDYLKRDIQLSPGTVDLSDYLGASPGNAGMLPYLAIIRRKLPDVPISLDNDKAELCFGILQRKLTRPCMVELIWSYWHEEAMLVQTMNVITRRFQNVSSGATNDPLANLEIDPLRPLNNLIWGYVQDEQHRLTVIRRSYEYDHQYGLRLDGRAVQNFRPADSRSRFLEAFHQLLRLCNNFYRQDDDTNVKADAFPVLNAIKEVHMILSQGAHNQFGDLPSTARVEMLMQQWLLARPEFREFLPTRIMVAYPEPWMDRVDAMKKLQGWTDTSVMHFHALATFGEQLILSIRYGNWSVLFEPVQAFNWARLWRPQIQGYIHSYRAVTGVDLATDQRDPAADGTLPSVLLRRRLAEQARRV